MRLYVYRNNEGFCTFSEDRLSDERLQMYGLSFVGMTKISLAAEEATEE